MTSSYTPSDTDTEVSLRPQTLEDYIGQEKIKENLKIYIDAAKIRGDSLDHVLLYGPPGLGKTTLSNIIANEMGVNIRITSGPAIEKQGDLAALLTNLNEGDVLFIDEIHRLSRSIEEILYPAMEDYALDIIIGKGPSARSIRIDLPKFTLIGATTRAGQLTTPLRDRFGVLLKLELYTPDELATIVKRSAGILELEITNDGAYEIASRSRGTPRIANRLLKRVRDYAQVKGSGIIDSDIANYALGQLEIDALGLDNTDRRMLKTKTQLEHRICGVVHKRSVKRNVHPQPYIRSVPEIITVSAPESPDPFNNIRDAQAYDRKGIEGQYIGSDAQRACSIFKDKTPYKQRRRQRRQKNYDRPVRKQQPFAHVFPIHRYLLIFTVKTDPSPGALCTLISPCTISTTRLTKASPSPFPRVAWEVSP